MSGIEEVLRGLSAALSCNQCGRTFNKPACGPTHASISADPRQHLLVQPLIRQAQAEALREAATAFSHMWQADSVPGLVVYRALRARADRLSGAR